MKGILSLSGGLDSSTILSCYEDEIHLCVFANYGSKQNDRERIAARAIADHYGKDLIELDLAASFANFKSALLAHSKEEIEDGAYADKEVSNAFVPFRNGIFASYMVGLAESFGLDTIFMGMHGGDHRLYPDCRPGFVDKFNALVKEYSEGKMQVFAPFLHYTKRQIADIAAVKRLPMHLTYSCYKGNVAHCGTCPTCIERRDALGLFAFAHEEV